jgi:CDP-glucose 4,6-dehydratase
VAIDRSAWSGRRVLVTGHTGFKGAWLTLWLQSLGARVSGLARGVASTPSLYELARVGADVSNQDVDVRDHDGVSRAFEAERPEVVFHLAAQPLVRRSLRDPHGTYEINVMGTVNVLDAVRTTSGVRAVVVVTSDKCYENRAHGDGGLGRAFVEDDPMGGHDPYSSSKGCAELVTAAYRASFFASGERPRVASARAGNVIGGGDWGEDRLIPDVVRAARDGRAVRVRNPEAVRPWQHVLAPLSGYLLLAQALLDSPADAEGWNFGPPAEAVRTVRWIADCLESLWPGRVEWELDEGPHPPEAHFLALDSKKARTRLQWDPPWDLDDALGRIVEWHDAHERGEDMRAVSLSQIDAFARDAHEGTAAAGRGV